MFLEILIVNTKWTHRLNATGSNGNINIRKMQICLTGKYLLPEDLQL